MTHVMHPSWGSCESLLTSSVAYNDEHCHEADNGPTKDVTTTIIYCSISQADNDGVLIVDILLNLLA